MIELLVVFSQTLNHPCMFSYVNRSIIMDAKSITPELVEKWTQKRLSILDYTLSDIKHSPHSALDNSQHAMQPTEFLGDLSLLPLEILTHVIYRLDVLSLNTFRRVNKHAMLVVDSIPNMK
ncbi:hypothetical protein F5Y12DRAFT_16100 [Xylaria sp. FL1777]|nr:hypothetical protein F5Y12DRAFT_16100 [Xylaria sp. FL1777]